MCRAFRRIRQWRVADPAGRERRAAYWAGCAEPTGNLRCERKNFGIISTTYMCMLDKILAKRDEIYAIARRHKAEKLWVFGSCARREERPDSDVDFLVKWMPGEYSWRNERAMSSAYEKLLGSRVDLVASRILPQSLGFAHRVCKEAVPV